MIQTTVKVEGMFCSMCESRVKEAIARRFDVRKVHASRKKKEAVILSETALPQEELQACIEEAGYETGAVQSEEYVKKGFFGF